MASQVGTQGRNAGNSFNQGIAAGMNAAVGSTQSGIARIRGAIASIGSQYGAGFGIGDSLGAGIAAGIGSWAGRIAGQAASVVRDAVGAARREADAASPSRKMIELGRDMGKGLVLGLERSSDAVSRAFGGIVPTGNAMALGFSSPATAGASTTVTQVTVISLRSEEFTRLLEQAETGASFAATFPDELGIG